MDIGQVASKNYFKCIITQQSGHKPNFSNDNLSNLSQILLKNDYLVTTTINIWLFCEIFTFFLTNFNFTKNSSGYVQKFHTIFLTFFNEN